MEFLPIFFGLASAISWGAGDFNGGIAAKRSNAFGVVITAHCLSIVILVVTALMIREPIPPLESWFWGGAAGLGGGIGLLLLYRALAEGRMSVAAPVSALLAAAMPVTLGLFTDSPPGVWTLLGFGLALTAVWLISAEKGLSIRFADLTLPLLAGVSFGAFFIFLHRASLTSILWPMVAVRIVSISSLLGFAILTRQPWLPTRSSLLPIILSGLLDTAGNAFYSLSAQIGRADVAAVLSSLYPGSTVLLAWMILKEKISRTQVWGIGLALVAIVLMTISL
jgi:uncharacterized membrane protein